MASKVFLCAHQFARPFGTNKQKLLRSARETKFLSQKVLWCGTDQ